MKYLIGALTLLIPTVTLATDVVEFTSKCGGRHTVVYPDSCPPCPCQSPPPVKTRVGLPWKPKPVKPAERVRLSDQLVAGKGSCK